MLELWSRFLGFRRCFSARHLEPDKPREFARLLGVLETFSQPQKEMIVIGKIVNSADVETRRLHNARLVGRLVEQFHSERELVGNLALQHPNMNK